MRKPHGKQAYTTLAFNFDGRVYAALYPDQTDVHHVVIGHPVVCDNDDVFIEAMPRTGAEGHKYIWHVAVSNPTDASLTVTLKPGMDVPGLDFPPRQETVAAGACCELDLEANEGTM